MTTLPPRLTGILKLLPLYLLILAVLAGCTSMVAHTSIDPYISDKVKRDSLEQLAKQYCQEKQAQSGTAKPIRLPDYLFTTDGCSRWLDKSWVSCCVAHDIAYWCGGSYEDREEADQLFKQCVNQKAEMMGGLMHLGVRIGGSPWWPTPWRWGYGWKKWPKGYQKAGNPQAIVNILSTLHIQETLEKQLK